MNDDLSVGGAQVARPRAAVLLTLGAALATSACSEAPVSTAERPVEAQQAMTCTTIVRGSGGSVVADAELASDPTDPSVANTNLGAGTSLRTGTVGTSSRLDLVRFDLGSFPSNAVVSSATLSLHKVSSPGGGTISVHRVTSPWTESTVTSASFGGAYDSSAAATITPASVPNGAAMSTDVTGLVASWVNGAYANEGVALVQSTGRTTLGASEASSANPRPRLTVCIAPPSCGDGVQSGSETGVDCGGACAPCGACIGVTCQASDACHLTGTCNPATGLCSNPIAPFGASCDDANACTTIDTCQNGVCTGSPAGAQPSPDICDGLDNDCDGVTDPGCPTCSDGAQNGSETGVDCGGSCPACLGGGASCLQILQAGSSQGDGVYTLDADGAGPSPAFQAYCDMANGGWTLVATMAHIAQGFPDCNDGVMLNAAATAQIPLPGQFCRKLSDAQINVVKSTSVHLNAYRVSCGGGTRFFRTACDFNSTAPVGSGACNGAAGGLDATDYFSHDHESYYGLVAGEFGSHPLKMFYWANGHQSCLGPDDGTYFGGTNQGDVYIL